MRACRCPWLPWLGHHGLLVTEPGPGTGADGHFQAGMVQPSSSTPSAPPLLASGRWGGRRRRLCAWPGGHGPAPVEPKPPSGASRCLRLRRPIPHRRRASFGRQQQVRHAPLLLIPTRGLGLNLTKWNGLTAKSVTQMNSADKDLFTVNLLNLWKFIVIPRKFVK